MTLIGWLVVVEIVVSLGLLIWYAQHAHKRVKHSPAEQALQQHLAELEAEKANKVNQPAEIPKKPSKKTKKS